MYINGMQINRMYGKKTPSGKPLVHQLGKFNICILGGREI